MIGTSQYELEKYLDNIIKPSIPRTFMLESTDEFLTSIRNVSLCENSFMCSFDVESLFTNVPLNESIELACKYVYESENRPTFDRKHFRKLLEFATSGVFHHKDVLYKQIDGVAMGSPLGPTLANLFMAHYERQWMDNCNPEFRPDLYVRYVDDIFCSFSVDKCNDFLFF